MGSYILDCINPQSHLKYPVPLGLSNLRVGNLDGKNIGIIWCGKSGGENFLDVTAEILSKKFKTANILRFTWGETAADEIIKAVDTFIYGVGDSGIGAWESTTRTIVLEKLGKPGVVVFCDHLIHNARESARIQGMPPVRMATVPSITYYPNRISVNKIRPVVEKSIDDIIRALIMPVTCEEANPDRALLNEKPERTKVSADSYESVYEKFNNVFLEYHWGDGLPLVPPTDSAVKLMLSGINRSPQEVIGSIASPDGLAVMGEITIEKIAVNAVLAGAKPDFLPVIVAAIECLTDKNFSPHSFTSEGAFTLAIMVSGPVARKINMNAGIGLLGHGWRANNTIGRAVRLCLINLGRLWPAEFDMALIGRPSSHTYFVFTENMEDSPWEPYHVDRGYRPEESTVTVSTVGGNGDIGMKIYGGGTVIPWTAESVLESIVSDVAKGRSMFSQFRTGRGGGISSHPQKYIIVLHPEMAIEINRKGFSRRSLQDYINETTKLPYEMLSAEEVESLKSRMYAAGDVFFGADAIPKTCIPAFEAALKPGGRVPIITSPDDINIMVAGGISGYTFGMSYARGAHLTRLVR